MSLPSEIFEYEPLPSKKCIRLVSLILEKSQSRLPPMIYGVPLLKLSVATVDLADNPEYDALSYTWGSPFPEKSEKSKAYKGGNAIWPVSINGCLHYIGRNLWEFLHQQLQPMRLVIDAAEDGVEKRYPPYDKTRLIQWAEKGYFYNVKQFLSMGADTTAQDEFGETALHYAAENGHLEVVKMLVNHGSDVTIVDSTGRTPLACAKQRERGDYVKVIEFLENVDDLRVPEIQQYPLPLSEHHGIWIDSICINQNDIAERNAQVALMSEIYSKAMSVKVWLGVEDEYMPDAFRSIATITETTGEKYDGLAWWMNLALTNTMYTEEHRAMVAEHLTPKNYSNDALKCGIAVGHLFERTWWSRVWIIQELALAKEIYMYCGTLYMPMAPSFSLIPLCSSTGVRRVFKAPVQQSWKSRLEYTRLFDVKGIEACLLMEIRLRTCEYAVERGHLLRRAAGWNGFTISPTWNKRLSLPAVGTMAWWFQATDPRDKIFALIGLAEPPDPDQETIIADYSRSTADVFIEYGKIFMQGSPEHSIQSLQTGQCHVFESLEGFSYVQHNPDPHPAFLDPKSQLPSWTPNFSVPLITDRIWSRVFSAAEALPDSPIILPCPDPRVLRVNGMIFDEIVAIQPSDKDKKNASLSPLGWLEFILALNPDYVSGGNRVDALLQTLTIGQLQESPSSGFRDFMKKNLPSTTDHPRLSLWLAQLRDDAQDILPSFEELESRSHVSKRATPHINPFAEFDITCRRYHKARSLFRTKKGYLGLGPIDMKRGDGVWLLAGARIPFILRKKRDIRGLVSKMKYSFRDEVREDQLKLVGECYVHGIMNGEASCASEFHPVSLI